MSPRQALIAGNWKMNMTIPEAKAFAVALREQLTTLPAGVQVVVAPTGPALYPVSQALEGSAIAVSGQDVHPQPSGAFTGEVSAAMLQAAGCTYCIVGHSERRQYFKESDDFIKEKVDALLAQGLTPILCLGESLEQREAGETVSHVTTQLDAAFAGRQTAEATKIVVAYEPIWAIGTGKTATPAQAQDVHRALRARLSELFDTATANQIQILYGGSVKPANVDALMSEADIDGALVGGASLKVDSFARLVNFQTTA